MIENGGTELFEAIPIIKRARGYRLYDCNGNRYLDLYQNNGSAILGHRAGRLTTVLKNTISSGMIFDLPSIYERRLLRKLAGRYPEYSSFSLCSSLAEALGVSSGFLNQELSPQVIKDPAWGTYGPICYERPFLPKKNAPSNQEIRVLIPLFPFRIGGSPVIVCSKENPAAAIFMPKPISALLLAGILRSIHDLEHFEAPPWYEGDILKDCPGWITAGPYIRPNFESHAYPEIFRNFLKEGILLSPVYGQPSILPGEASEGELKKMVRLFFKYPGK